MLKVVTQNDGDFMVVILL